MASIEPGFCGHCGTKMKWLFQLEAFCPNECDRKPVDYAEDDWTWPDNQDITCLWCGSNDTEPFSHANMQNAYHCIKCGRLF
jgi:hypothetical protein